MTPFLEITELDLRVLVIGLANSVLVNQLRPFTKGNVAQSTHKYYRHVKKGEG